LQLTKLVDEEDDDKEDGNTIEGEEEIKVKGTIISSPCTDKSAAARCLLPNLNPLA
jgi:hypothetical protein